MTESSSPRRPMPGPTPRPSSGTRVRSPRDPQVGETLEGFELLSSLAASETLVFTARRIRDDRRVVLRIPAERGLEAGIALVANESELGMYVDHPQLVRVVARGTWSERPFVAREHVAGLSLQTVLDALARRTRRLEAPLAGMIAIRIARALSALHTSSRGLQRGLVHGDLHPGNVLVGSSGHVKLADLGSARALPDVGGTAPAPVRFPAQPYASPEQTDRRLVDERSDVFALAAILVRLLAGHEPPLHRPIAAWAFDALVDEAPALRRLLVASLEREPSGRPESARAFAEALAQAMPSAASWNEADLVRSLRGSPRSEPVVGLRASTPPPEPPVEPVLLGAPTSEPPPELAEEITPRPRRAPRLDSPSRDTSDATRPLRPDEHRSSTFTEPSLDAPGRGDETARTLLDRALVPEPTPAPARLPTPVEGVGDAPVPMFRFVAFFALAALAALAGAAFWYFRMR